MEKKITAVILVNDNDTESLERCFKSLKHNLNIHAEVLVLNNVTDPKIDEMITLVKTNYPDIITVLKPKTKLMNKFEMYLYAAKHASASQIFFISSIDRLTKMFWREIFNAIKSELDITIFSTELISKDNHSLAKCKEYKYKYDEIFVYKVDNGLTNKLFDKEFFIKNLVNDIDRRFDLVNWAKFINKTTSIQYFSAYTYQRTIKNPALKGWKEELYRFEDLTVAAKYNKNRDEMIIYCYNELVNKWLRHFNKKEQAFFELNNEINHYMRTQYGDNWLSSKPLRRFMRETRKITLW